MASKSSEDVLSAPKIALVNFPELRKMLGGASRRTLNKWMDCERFPQPFVVGVRGVRWWVVDEVLMWIAERPRLGGEATAEYKREHEIRGYGLKKARGK